MADVKDRKYLFDGSYDSLEWTTVKATSQNVDGKQGSTVATKIE
jgi:hypothetical protein